MRGVGSVVGVTEGMGEGLGNSTFGVSEVKGVATSAGMHPVRTKMRIMMPKGRMGRLSGKPCLGAMDAITLVSEN
jgi:hypothetical protein